MQHQRKGTDMTRETSEYTVRNDKGKVITVAPKELVWRWLHHCCADGIYGVTGPNTDCTVERKDGTLYPTSGHVDGVKFPPRTVEEFKQIFELGE
jgi:hypothetical protein